MTNKMFAELTFSSPGNGDENVKKVLNSFLKGFKTGDKLNLSLNKMTLEVLFKEVPPVEFITSMFENARVEKLTIAPIKGVVETEAEQEATETETEQEAEQETKQEAETEAETKEEAEKKAEAEPETTVKPEEKTDPPIKKRGRPRKVTVIEPKAEETQGEETYNFSVLREKLGLVLPDKRMEDLIKKMDIDSVTRPEKQRKILKDLLYGAKRLRKEGRDIIVDDILVNNGISENDAAMCRMVASSWVNAYALTHGCKEKIKLEDFLNEVAQLE